MNLFGLNITFDFWFFFGISAQVLFFFRFILQWIVSEKRKESVIPPIFWYLSLLGAAMLGIYAHHRDDAVIFLGSVLSLVVYGRNIMLINNKRRRDPS